MNQTKTCTKCHIEKSISEFSKQLKSKDGYRSHCKTCIKKYNQGNAKHIAEYKKNITKLML